MRPPGREIKRLAPGDGAIVDKKMPASEGGHSLGQ
jgi:hypothetical protein